MPVNHTILLRVCFCIFLLLFAVLYFMLLYSLLMVRLYIN